MSGFAHESELRFASLLDSYGVKWEYEPRSFPIQWDREGLASQLFTPDFYLPDHDVYIELTTMKQKLVTKKNRKVRRLRELYPEVRIKVLYRRDYLNLTAQYGAPQNHRRPGPSIHPVARTAPGGPPGRSGRGPSRLVLRPRTLAQAVHQPDLGAPESSGRPPMPSTMEIVSSRTGVTELRRRWRASHPWATLLIVHGVAEHSGRYEQAGAGLAAAGIDTYAFDLQGFGGSGGPRADIDSWST